MSQTPAGIGLSPDMTQVMAELLKKKLQTVDGTAKCAEYGAAYLRDRAHVLRARNAITEFEEHMFSKLVDIMRACAEHLALKEEATNATG